MYRERERGRISITLGSRNGHRQIWKGSIAYHTCVEKIWQTWGVSLAGEIMIYLIPERC